MSASSKKKLHAEEANAKLTEKQLAQQKEDKKVKAYTIAFAAARSSVRKLRFRGSRHLP